MLDWGLTGEDSYALTVAMDIVVVVVGDLVFEVRLQPGFLDQEDITLHYEFISFKVLFMLVQGASVE